MTELAEELLRLEHDGWRSLCDGTGDRFYGSIMTDDGIMILAHGVGMNREDVVASLADAPSWTTYELGGERVIPLGPDSAALSYTGRGFRDGEPPFVALMSSVYRRESGRWRLALYQQTPIPHEA
jgi:hypothetical protein